MQGISITVEISKDDIVMIIERQFLIKIFSICLLKSLHQSNSNDPKTKVYRWKNKISYPLISP